MERGNWCEVVSRAVGEGSMELPESTETYKDLFANYSEYNKVLRTWFVTFGLGGVSVFLINDKLGTTLKASGYMPVIVYAFLVGCALQILIALINKNCAWHAYNTLRYPH